MVHRILFFTHYSALYGANRSLLKILAICLNHNKEVFVIMPTVGGLSRKLSKMGVPWEVHRFKGWIGKESQISFSWVDNFKGNRNSNFNLRQIPKIERKIGDFKPDLVCSNSSIFNIGFLYSRKLNKPHIWFVRSHPEQYNFNWFQKEYTKRCFDESEVVIAISCFLKKFLEQTFSLKNIQHVYNAILSENELKSLDQRKKSFSRNDKDFTFGIVGLIHPKKGQDDAIKAFANFNQQYPDSKLLIIGAGNQKNLKKMARKLKISNKVIFTGHLDDPFIGFFQLDVSLVCSRAEGLGRVTLESMAMKLPVIGKDEGATAELIKNGENGLLYSGNPKDLCRKMVYLYKDKEKAKVMGENGRRFFERKFTSEVFSQNFLKIINKL